MLFFFFFGGAAARQRGDAGPGVRQRGELVGRGQRAVPDVVDPPGERVDGGQRAPLGRRQQPDAVREVAGLRPGDFLAVPVGRGHVHRVTSQLHKPSASPGQRARRGLWVAHSTSYPARRSRPGRPATGHETGDGKPGEPRNSPPAARIRQEAAGTAAPRTSSGPWAAAPRWSRRDRPRRPRTDPGPLPAGRCVGLGVLATSWQCSASWRAVQTRSERIIRSGVAIPNTCSTIRPTGLAEDQAVSDQITEGGIAADHLVLPGWPGSGPRTPAAR